VDDDGAWCFAYVFADETEVCAGIGSAICQTGFAIELMGDIGVFGHLAGVEGGGFGEDGIEVDGRKPFICAGLVGCNQEVLFGDGEVGFGLKAALGLEICYS
jgi:hypothetical protein